MQWIQKKICGYGAQKGGKVGDITLVISSKDMSDIMEVIKVLEDKGLLVEGTVETTTNEIQQQRGGFLGMLLGTLGASLLENLLS